MRTEQEMMTSILEFAKADPRIRVVGMEGSRTNSKVPKDLFQDYDISFLVTDLPSFQKSDDWLDEFGDRVILQKPEAMDFFPPELGNWFSYLMIFQDGNKMDLTLIPIEELEKYLESEGLLQILLDKDNRIPVWPVPTDREFWIQKPSKSYVWDCCNEFWFTSTYVAKGLCRNEILSASFHMEQIVRVQLFHMLSWMIGFQHGFDFSLGKHWKYIASYLTERQWELLMRTYSMDSISHAWEALFASWELFREASRKVAEFLPCDYPPFDREVSSYIEKWKNYSPSEADAFPFQKPNALK